MTREEMIQEIMEGLTLLGCVVSPEEDMISHLDIEEVQHSTYFQVLQTISQE